jgi:two-component system OmpR family sensor kinase
VFIRRLSIRARIALGSVIVAIIVTAIAVLVIRANVESILAQSNITLATTDLAPFQKDLVSNPGEPIDGPAAGILVMVRGPGGPPAVDTLPHDIHEALDHRRPANETFKATAGGVPYIVVGRVQRTSSGVWALWAARSAASSELALGGLDRVLVVGSIGVLIIFGLASWLLATVALRPVSRMRRRAEALSGIDEDDVLPVGPADDEIAALAKTLNALLARVRASTEREKQMVSDAAHELRTPLAALRTQLELAHDRFGDADALANEITEAEESIVRLSALATGLLELARLEGDPGTTPALSAQELLTEAMSSVDRARMLALAKSGEIEFEAGDLDDTAKYLVGAASFGRLIDNLLSNAIAAIGDRGHVELSIQQDALGLRIEVRDDGPGIPEAFLPVAFDRFSRPDVSRTGSTGGSGLGLALVQAIARSAGGTAELHNAERGLVAVVTIPNM